MVATGSTPDLSGLNLAAGHPALDFVNSIDPRGGGDPDPAVDYLADHASLCRWAAYAGLIDEDRAAELIAAGTAHPRLAAAAFRRGVELREALYRATTALVEATEPAPADIEVITAEAREALAQASLAIAPDAGERGAAALRLGLEASDEPEAVLWPIARSALELLTEADASRLRVCPVEDGGCGWVVLDATRNRSRRWCDMSDCGTEVKSKRLSERRRADRARGR